MSGQAVRFCSQCHLSETEHRRIYGRDFGGSLALGQLCDDRMFCYARAAERRGRALERSRVVAWLRASREPLLDQAAELIRAGVHDDAEKEGS